MKTTLIILLIILISSCGKRSLHLNGNKPILYSQENLIQVNSKLNNFDNPRKFKMLKALKLLEKIINSQEFKDRVIDHTYNNEYQYRNNNELTNEQIYEKILEAKEKQLPIINNTMDLSLTLYYTRSGTVGYTNTGSLEIFVNTKFFDSFELSSIAANLMHEWLHKIGFSHDKRKSVSRGFSVPYAIGSITRELGQSLE